MNVEQAEAIAHILDDAKDQANILARSKRVVLSARRLLTYTLAVDR